MTKRKYSQTVRRAPSSIDNELHKSEKNRKRNNAMLHFPSVLPIVGYNTRIQKQNRVNLTTIPFSQISIYIVSLRVSAGTSYVVVHLSAA